MQRAVPVMPRGGARSSSRLRRSEVRRTGRGHVGGRAPHASTAFLLPLRRIRRADGPSAPCLRGRAAPSPANAPTRDPLHPPIISIPAIARHGYTRPPAAPRIRRRSDRVAHARRDLVRGGGPAVRCHGPGRLGAQAAAALHGHAVPGGGRRPGTARRGAAERGRVRAVGNLGAGDGGGRPRFLCSPRGSSCASRSRTAAGFCRCGWPPFPCW